MNQQFISTKPITPTLTRTITPSSKHHHHVPETDPHRSSHTDTISDANNPQSQSSGFPTPLTKQKHSNQSSTPNNKRKLASLSINDDQKQIITKQSSSSYSSSFSNNKITKNNATDKTNKKVPRPWNSTSIWKSGDAFEALQNTRWKAKKFIDPLLLTYQFKLGVLLSTRTNSRR